MREVVQIALATTVSAIPLFLMRSIMVNSSTLGALRNMRCSYGVIVINYLVVIFGVTGVRASGVCALVPVTAPK